MADQVRFFTLNRWKLTDDIVNQCFSFDTSEEASQKGLSDQETYRDQKACGYFKGSWEEFNRLVTDNSQPKKKRGSKKS